MTVVDTLKVNFEAEWTGASAVSRMTSDLQKVESMAGNVNRAFTSMGNAPVAGFEGVSRGAAETAVKLQHMQAIATNLRSSIAGLGQAQASGALSASEAATQYQQLTTALAQVEGAIGSLRPAYADTASAARQHTASLGEIVSKYRAFVFSATAILASIKGITAVLGALRDASRDGAGINQMSESFANLSQNIVGVPNLLGNMRTAAQGTISDMQLMSSFMTLVAGTSESFGKSLANQAPRLLEIAKAAQKLNPSLGDTAFLFDSLARGIKRSEIRILDNLGIIVKVGEANKKYAAEIGKSVLALTAEEKQIALLNETLRVGSRLIEQAGGTITSLVDPYQQVSVAQENATNSLKGWLAAIGETAAIDMAGSLGAIATEFDLLTDRIIENREELRGFIQDILDAQDLSSSSGKVQAFEDLGEALGEIPTWKAQDRRTILQPMEALVYAIIEGALSIEEAQERLNDAFGPGTAEFKGLGFANPWLEITQNGEKFVLDMSYINTDIEKANRDYQKAIAGFYEEGPEGGRKPRRKTGPAMAEEVLEDAEDERQALIDAARVKREGLAELKRLQQEFASEYADSLGYVPEVDRSASRAAGDASWRAAIKSRIEIMQEYAAAIDAIKIGAFRDILEDGESDFIVGNVKNIGDSIVTTTSATEDQRRALEAWKEEYRSAANAVWDLEHGINTFGIEQDKLAEKLADARGEMEHYADLINEVEGQITTSTSNVRKYIDIDEGNVYKSLIDAMEQAGASSSQLIGVSESLGLITPEAAEAAKAIGLIEIAVDIVGKKLADGLIQPGQAKEALDTLIAELEGGKTTAEIEVDVKYKVDRNWVTPTGAGPGNGRSPFLPEGDGTQFIPLSADISPFESAVGEATGSLPSYDSPLKAVVDADTSPAMQAFNEFGRQVESTELTVRVKVDVDKSGLDNLPGATGQGGAVGGGGGGNGSPDLAFHSGGFVTGNRSGDVRAVLQSGEYVMRRSAVDALGIPLLDRLNRGGATTSSTSNTIQITFNNYGQNGPGQTAPIAPILIKSDDPMTAIANTLRRAGVAVG